MPVPVPILMSAFAVAALTAFVVTPAVVRAAVSRGVYGHARIREGVEHKPVPRLGGIAVCIAMSVALLAAIPPALASGSLRPDDPARFFGGLLLAGWILFAAGIVDDLCNLRPRHKLLAQCLAALVAYAFGFRIEGLSFGEGTVLLGWMSLPLTVLWIVAVTNAFNLIDGLDGLATGIALVALVTTLAVAGMLGNGEVALVCAALAGALLGFLRYNLRPARIFLGDSGSLFVGFMLAVLSVHGSTKSATAVLAVIPVLVLALPLLDTLLAILRRWLRGTPIWGADERHLHHRLLAIGLTHTRAAVLLFLAAAGMAMLGLVLAFAPPGVVGATAGAGAAACVALLLFAIKRLGYHEFVEAGAAVTSGAARMRQSIRDQIHARDVANVIAQAESEEHLRAILADNAPVMGFLALAFCRESSREAMRVSLPPEQAARAWRLDYPLAVGGVHAFDGVRDTDGIEADPYVLRAWSAAEHGVPLSGSGRAVRVLAEAIQEWMERRARPTPVHPSSATPTPSHETARPSCAAAPAPGASPA